MKVVIVTEGLKGTGYGHLMRCLGIYQAFEEVGTAPIFVADCDDFGGQFLGRINPVVMDWRRNASEMARLCSDSDLILVDSYLADSQNLERLRRTSRQIAYLDDDLRIDYPPGVIINGTIGAEKLPYPKDHEHRYLLGIDYVPLRKEFWDVSPGVSRQDVENVLLIFGAQDVRDMAGKTLRSLMKAFPQHTYHVVRPPSSHGADDECDSPGVIFYRNLSAREILQLMLKCDLAVSAAGQTIYELARVGLPTIMVGVAENQRYNIQGWIEAGFLQTELWWDDADLFEELACQIRNKTALQRGSRTLCDGQGARRIVKYLSEKP